MEYIVTMTTHVPAGTPEEDVENIRAREALRARELADEGHLLRLWRPPLQPGEWRTVGLLPPRTTPTLKRRLPRCHCGCGARTKPRRLVPIRTTRPPRSSRAATSACRR